MLTIVRFFSSGSHYAMNKKNQWIVGINAVVSSIENDAEHVCEVLVEAGSKNSRLLDIEEKCAAQGN